MKRLWIASSSATGRNPACLARGRLWRRRWRRRGQRGNGAAISRHASRFSTRAAARPRRIIASDLPLQGSNRALTTEMAQAVEFILKQHDWKAGGKTHRLPVLRRLDGTGW